MGSGTDVARETGDVILIEQQMGGPNFRNDGTQYGDVPVEWDQSGAVWNAIKNATGLGRIVVEAAGNGYQDLDSATYNDSTGRNWFASTLTIHFAQCIASGAIGKCGTRVTRRKLYLAASRNVAYALSATSAAISGQRAAA